MTRYFGIWAGRLLLYLVVCSRYWFNQALQLAQTCRSYSFTRYFIFLMRQGSLAHTAWPGFGLVKSKWGKISRTIKLKKFQALTEVQPGLNCETAYASKKPTVMIFGHCSIKFSADWVSPIQGSQLKIINSHGNGWKVTGVSNKCSNI